jgi:hypothetical protein
MKACIALITVCLIVSLSILTLPIKAQEQEPLNLTIKPDGSIEPNTDFLWLQRNGSTYTFVVDIFGTITVQRAGITIDGAGHTLQGNSRGINLVGHDEAFNAYSNVLVKNLRISNFAEGIYTPSNNNSFIGNFFDNARMHILGGPVGNVIKHNIFNSTEIFIDYNMGGSDIITENNFIDSSIFIDIAKPPIVDRNYWSNYTAEYPNAKELDNSGIWDTPNVYDKFVGGSHGNYSAIDYHPLVNPITDFEIPNFNILPPSTPPTSTSHPTINTGAEHPETEPFTTAIIVAVAFVVVLAVAAGLLVYRNKHKQKS